MTSATLTAPLQPQPATAAAALRIGDILVGTSGWEQTNIRFYQVVSVGAKTVEIRQLHSRITAVVGWAHQMNEPVIDAFVGYAMRRKVQFNDAGPCVLPSSFEVASPWDGTAQLSTHYA